MVFGLLAWTDCTHRLKVLDIITLPRHSLTYKDWACMQRVSYTMQTCTILTRMLYLP